MTVDVEQLRALLEVLVEQNVAEFEHESGGVRVRIVRGGGRAIEIAAPPPAASAVVVAPQAAPISADVLDVTSPFVGTFYRAPTPDTPPFIEVGSVVRPGQTLCIIEA